MVHNLNSYAIVSATLHLAIRCIVACTICTSNLNPQNQLNDTAHWLGRKKTDTRKFPHTTFLENHNPQDRAAILCEDMV